MKKKLLMAAVVLTAIVVYAVSAGLKVSADAAKESVFDTEKIFEAEDGRINGPVTKYSNENVSGGYYLMNHYTSSRKLDNPAMQELPDVSYAVNIPDDGDYFIWMRVKVPMAGNEILSKYLSVYVGSENANYNACTVDVCSDWKWQKITNLRLAKGTRNIDLKHKDFGFGFDQLFITATGSDLSELGKSPGREEILRANFNIPTPIIYPPLTEADGAGTDFIKPPAGHPRLFLREKDIPVLKAKAKDPFFTELWDKLTAGSKDPFNGMLDAPVDGRANYNPSALSSIDAKALMYVLNKDRTMGRNAIDAMINFFRTVKLNPSTNDIYRIYGRFIISASIVYDWCYDLLKEDEKKVLIEWIETMASRMEIGWPRIRQGAVTGHASELQLMRDFISAGIATYDEKPDMYLLAAGRFFKYYISARKFFYPAAYHHQGSSYGITRFVCEMWPTYIFDRMGYPAIFGEEQGSVPYYWIYMRRPDGQFFRDGDDFLEKNEFLRSWPNQGFALAGYYFRDPVIIGEAVKQGGIGRGSDVLFDFLFYHNDVKPVTDKSSLPLSKYFKEPFGAILSRTNWEEGINSDAVIAQMKLGVYNFLNHQHLDAGNFQLYYKGPLAVESGIYEGSLGGYGTSHDVNYNKRTIAHNTMLVYNPDEQIRRNTVNDGGQRYPNNGGEVPTLEALLNNDCKTAEVLAHDIGPDKISPEYSYLKGDLTLAYSNKIKKFHRSFVFLDLKDKLHPAALIVYDMVSSADKNFSKYWLLHCVEEPDVQGIKTTIVRGEKGYNGKLVNTTLLPGPENLTINKVGGKGMEFPVFGKNFPQYYSNDRNAWDGAIWRIEVMPKKASITDNFLNVMQVMDYKNGPSPLTVRNVRSDKMVGAMIADRVVLFSRTSERVGEKIRFTLEEKDKLKVLVTDLQPGTWRVERSGEKAKAQYIVSPEGNSLYFEGTAGDYTLTRSGSLQD